MTTNYDTTALEAALKKVGAISFKNDAAISENVIAVFSSEADAKEAETKLKAMKFNAVSSPHAGEDTQWQVAVWLFDDEMQ